MGVVVLMVNATGPSRCDKSPTSPFLQRLARLPNGIGFFFILLSGWLFASDCSLPHLSMAQFPSATNSQFLLDRDFHPIVGRFKEGRCPWRPRFLFRALHSAQLFKRGAIMVPKFVDLGGIRAEGDPGASASIDPSVTPPVTFVGKFALGDINTGFECGNLCLELADSL